jgi:nucleoside 2-deoxyribosyltransferase
MKIVVSGSYKKIGELEKAGEDLRKLGFEVHTPMRSNYTICDHKMRRDLIDEHLKLIKECDIFIIGNIKSPGEKYGRVGASTYFETGWAYALSKRIYSLEAIDPKSDFAEDLLALEIVSMNGDVELIK